MKKLIVALTCFSLTALSIYAGPTCMGYTQKNLETGVGKGGKLRSIRCGCECRKFERTSDNRCMNCLHHQAGSPIDFMTEPTTPTVCIKKVK